MKRALYLALFLALTAGLAGGMLSFVNDLTKDTIEAAALEKELIYLEEIFPGANFKALTEEVANEPGILDLFEAEGKGKVYKVVSNGYGGEIVFLVGFDNDQKIAGIAVISHSETPGFGDVIETDQYRQLNVGRTGGEALDISSGATVSSNAVNSGIQAAATHLSGGTLEVEVPDVNFGVKLPLNTEKADKYTAEILSSEVDGENTVYEVSAKGYGLVAPEYPSDDYKENIFKIVLNTESRAIVSIEMIQFGDTVGLGDMVDNPKFFETFVGVSSLEDEVDTVTNATMTSYSVISAVRAAIEGQ